MKKSLFFALFVVSTLTCIAPAGAKVIKNHDSSSSCNVLWLTQSNNTATAVEPADRKKPANPVAAGSYYY